MRIVLHPGPHKTATTMVQSALKTGLGGQIVGGAADARNLAGLADDFRTIRWAFVALNMKPTKKRVENARQLLRKFAESAEAMGVTNLVVSDENFLGHPPTFFVLKHGEARYYRHNSATAEAIAEAFEPWEVEIVFTTRKQETLFPSHYMDGIRWVRLDMSLDEFWALLLQEGIDALRFDKLAEPWRDHFGAQKVSHLGYELLEEAPDVFMKGISERFHLPPASLALPGKRVNGSLPGFKIELARQLFRDIAAGTKERKAARHELLKAEPLPGQEEIPRPRLSAKSLDEIRAAFADDLSYSP
ncbi:hypothetical protein RGQ15_00595 [Paracoccus sp. MBLB3053]|uniref:Sulfotransferase family protein n=1 Tax=Paracoccus aurantius TaxID=3073814 RepID=A0ABU2HM10_9RHOB|nr:hypothetical protein [Paracoccus sp. MBLB3053]MDS9466075.1 hypothetical protein [Paracoccus sp. MBLB3053]